MYSLDPPERDARVLYREVTKRRARSTERLLQGIESVVFDAYSAYEREAITDAAALSAKRFEEPEVAALKSNYRRVGEVFNYVREELFGLAPRGRCAMCADRKASTLDHYAPKDAYPEFAVFPKNLVPVCKDCNFVKDEAFAAGGRAIFLHAYFDDLGDEACVKADVDTCTGAALLDFRIECPSSVPRRLRGRLASHFRELELADHYRFQGEQEASVHSILAGRRIANGETSGAIRQSLLDERDASIRVSGPNHWRAVTFAALAACDEFCAGACS